MKLQSCAALGCAVLAGSLLAAGSRANQPLHAPNSPVEHALDAILKTAGDDDDQLDNLFDGRGKPDFKKTVDYTTLLTKALLSAIADREKAIVRQECGGHYMKDETCGLDYLPINCAQDTNDSYVYETVKETDSTAEIRYAWPNQKSDATYRLVLSEGHWKLDGIACVEADSFNMK